MRLAITDRSGRSLSLSLPQAATLSFSLAYKAFGTCCRQYIRSARAVTSGLTNRSTSLWRTRHSPAVACDQGTEGTHIEGKIFLSGIHRCKSDGKDGGNQADASHAEEDPHGLLRDRTYDRLLNQSLRIKVSGILDILENRSLHHRPSKVESHQRGQWAAYHVVIQHCDQRTVIYIYTCTHYILYPYTSSGERPINDDVHHGRVSERITASPQGLLGSLFSARLEVWKFWTRRIT